MITPKILQAITVATNAHNGQHRKGSDLPYISHPYSVMLFAAEITSDEDTLAAALLHDVLEDCSDVYSEANMRRDFGDTVTDIVLDVTEKKRPDEKASWKIRKDEYLAHLAHASEQALIVSLADKTHNLTTLLEDYEQYGDMLWERFNAGKEQQLWFYASIADALSERLNESTMRYYKNLVDQFQENLQKP